MNTNKSLEDLINQSIASGKVELPVFDDIALRIHREVRENKLDAELMCNILEEDPVLVTELLRMANSSFFSGMNPVTSLREAAVRLGVRQIASIVFSVSQKRMYSASNGLFKARLTSLWRHTSAVSIGARWLAANTGYRNLADEAFVAGLLHDVGKLSLLCIMEDLMSNDGLELSSKEVDRTLRQMCCEHGGVLLDLWDLPESFKAVVANMNKADFDENNVILCMIRLVDKVCQLEGVSDLPDEEPVDLRSLAETKVLGLSDSDIDELSFVVSEVGGNRKAAA